MFGYNADKTEYNSPYSVSIFYEDIDMYWVIASTAKSAQSALLREDINLRVFEFFTPTVIVLSSRFTTENYAELREIGYKNIITIDENATGADTIANLDNVVDYVKLAGNAYALYDDYLSVHFKREDHTKIHIKLRNLKKGLTYDGSKFSDRLSEICDRIIYTSMITDIIAEGRAIYRMGDYIAQKNMLTAKHYTILGENIAVINSCELSCEALLSNAPILFTNIIYATYDYKASVWNLECFYGTKSAIDLLTAVSAEATGTIQHANASVFSLVAFDAKFEKIESQAPK
jgi:hypothetical protein